jgi:NADH:ubiquinone oxidoreductase subunit 4 (subunit M)
VALPVAGSQRSTFDQKMKVVELAFFGVGFFAAFIFVHMIYKCLQQDPTNVEFRNSIAVALVAAIILRYGLSFGGTLLSLSGLAVVASSLVVSWKLAGLLFDLLWWEGLVLGVTASAAFLLFYLGGAWAWGRVVEFP